MSNVTIRYAIVCDTIRQENTGKYILVGTYGSDMGFASFPAKIAIELLLAIQVDVPDPGDVELELQFQLDGKKLNGARLTLELQRAPAHLDLPIPLPRVPLDVQAPGMLSVLARSSDTDEWQVATRIAIVERVHDDRTSSNDPDGRETKAPPAQAKRPPRGRRKVAPSTPAT